MRRIAGLGMGVVVLLGALAALAQSEWPNRGRLGMEVQSMTDALREYFGAPADRGVLVVRVLPERAAKQAGVRVGDVLTGAGGEAIDAPVDLIAAVARVPAGGTLALAIVRDGKPETIEVAPEGDAVAFQPPTPRLHPDHGPAAREHPDFHDEILHRLQTIEQRLEAIGPK